jgi:hypothetical protein
MAWSSGMSWVTSLRLPPVRETGSGIPALQTRTHAESSTYKTAHADVRLRILMHDLSVGAIYRV